MRDSNEPSVRASGIDEETHRAEPDVTTMWENLCLADELLEDCEAMADGDRTGGSPEQGS